MLLHLSQVLTENALNLRQMAQDRSDGSANVAGSSGTSHQRTENEGYPHDLIDFLLVNIAN